MYLLLQKNIEQLKIALQKEKKLKELCDGEAEKKAQRLEIEKKKQYPLHRFSMEEYTQLNRDIEKAQRLHQQLLE
jgi:aminoglycoside phosphotransferase